MENPQIIAWLREGVTQNWINLNHDVKKCINHITKKHVGSPDLASLEAALQNKETLCKQLTKALEQNNPEEVTTALAAGANVNQVNNISDTALVTACKYEPLAIPLLLAAGVKAGHVNNHNMTGLKVLKTVPKIHPRLISLLEAAERAEQSGQPLLDFLKADDMDDWVQGLEAAKMSIEAAKIELASAQILRQQAADTALAANATDDVDRAADAENSDSSDVGLAGELGADDSASGTSSKGTQLKTQKSY